MIRDKKTDYSVQTVSQALDILELLIAADANQVTLPYLSHALGASRNKMFRLLSTLEGRGLVEREEGSGGRYRLGLCAVELSQRILRTTSLIRHAHPVMEELARRHDEAVYMTVMKGDEVMFLDMVDCAQGIKAAPLVGKRFPFFSNAAGKAIKALESRDLLERRFKRKGSRKEVPDLNILVSELDEIRKRGVAVDCGGLGDGIISVAVAVRDYAGKVVGAITLLGPSFRMLTDRLENEIIPSLREEAELLSQRFGYASG